MLVACSKGGSNYKELVALLELFVGDLTFSCPFIKQTNLTDYLARFYCYKLSCDKAEIDVASNDSLAIKKQISDQKICQTNLQ